MRNVQTIQRHRYLLIMLGLMFGNLPLQAAVVKDAVQFTSLRVEAAVDLNRDGKITFDEYDSDGNVLPNPDKTRLGKPFRFWVNNDFDVTSYMGTQTDLERCPPLPAAGSDGVIHQVCEVWDERVVGGRHNTADMTMQNGSIYNHLHRVDNVRDLEDFSPLAIRLAPARFELDYRVEIRAFGVSVNLFKGAWSDQGDQQAHAYIYDEGQTLEQIRVANGEGGYVGYAADDGEPIVIGPDEIELYFDEQGLGRFIIEGVEESRDSCFFIPSSCYLSVAVILSDNEGTSQRLAENRLYLDYRPISHFYQLLRAGNIVDTNPDSNASYEAQYDGQGISEVNPKIVDIFNGMAEHENDGDRHYALLVHGWRMRDAEKIQFADTSFKRMYWSGYKGSFGALMWPTGWHEKPAWAYGSEQLPFVIANQQNYGNSESVARRVGIALHAWLATLSGYGNVHVMAHSMGNVVASEALRHHAGQGLLLDNYIAMEAAEVAGSYHQGTADIQHRIQIPYIGIFDQECENNQVTRPAEVAWRCYNFDNLLFEEFDMPPDKYRYDVPLQHSATNDANMSAQNDLNGPRAGLHYYAGLSSTARIVNFFNGGDAALTGWEVNQLTKPDNIGTVTQVWEYGYNSVNCGVICEVGELVEDEFRRYQRGLKAVTLQLLEWRDALPIDADTADIMAHILPARTHALGQQITGGELGNNEDLFFTNSNQDHSGQFHGYLSEVRNQNAVRMRFWNLLLRRGVDLNILDDRDFTGLNNSVGVQ